MAGYDDYQTEEEYIAAAKKRWEREMDTKELVARLRRGCNCRLCKMDRCCCAEMEDAADTIERLERERDEAGAQIVSAREECPLVRRQDYFGTPLPALVAAQVSELFGWQSRAENAESELTTLRARVARLEEALRWELNILDVEVRPVVKPSKKEWIERRCECLRAALTEEPAS